MSLAAMQWAKRQTTGDGTTKLVLLLIADYASPGPDDGPHPDGALGRHYSYAGIERMSHDAEISTSTIKRHEQKLAALGLIRKVRRFNRAGNRTSDYIVLPVDDDGDRPWEADSTSGQSDLRSPVTPGPEFTGDPYIGTSSSEPPGVVGETREQSCGDVQAGSAPQPPSVHPSFPKPVITCSRPTEDELRADEEIAQARGRTAQLAVLVGQLQDLPGVPGPRMLTRTIEGGASESTPPWAIRRAVRRIVERGTDLAPWVLSREVSRIVADAQRTGPRMEVSR